MCAVVGRWGRGRDQGARRRATGRAVRARPGQTTPLELLAECRYSNPSLLLDLYQSDHELADGRLPLGRTADGHGAAATRASQIQSLALAVVVASVRIMTPAVVVPKGDARARRPQLPRRGVSEPLWLGDVVDGPVVVADSEAEVAGCLQKGGVGLPVQAVSPRAGEGPARRTSVQAHRRAGCCCWRRSGTRPNKAKSTGFKQLL